MSKTSSDSVRITSSFLLVGKSFSLFYFSGTGNPTSETYFEASFSIIYFFRVKFVPDYYNLDDLNIVTGDYKK